MEGAYKNLQYGFSNGDYFLFLIFLAFGEPLSLMSLFFFYIQVKILYIKITYHILHQLRDLKILTPIIRPWDISNFVVQSEISQINKYKYYIRLFSGKSFNSPLSKQPFRTNHMSLPNTINTRQKIGTLIKKFIKFLDDHHNKVLDMAYLIQQSTRIFKEYKKALEMIFYFEGLGLIMRISQQHGIFVGFRGMIRKLFEYECGQQNEPQVKYEELIIEGKYTSIKSQLLGGQLLANIFYKLIYQKEATSKSSIEEMVENFVMYQKQVNVKNFIPQILNVLSALNLVEKNQSTEVITYVGPDLKCFDENHRKISWKVLEVIRREEIAFGKEPTQIRHEKKIHQHHIDSKISGPSHVSYFPELFYAVLKSQNFEKKISNTVFFVGRTEKRPFGQMGTQKVNKTYKVDLDLNYKSVSRQHAVITYNFEVGRWEIRCLSKKNLIKVDEERYAWGDKNIWLRNKSEIQIGPQKMVFLQSSIPKPPRSMEIQPLS